MVRPLSNDLRKRVVAAVLQGESCRAAAARFGVAVSSVVKWSQRYRTTGSIMPGKMGGHRKRVLEPHGDFIRERIRQTSHLTLHGLKDELAARGVVVSHNAVWMFMRREGLRFKKTLFALEQGRADVARRRQRWRSLQRRLDPQRLVFIDETPAFAGAGYGSRLTWPLCAAGRRKESVCAASHLMATGAR